MTNPTENYMTPLNWRKGLMRLWLLCASVWLLAAPFWTNLPDEVIYAYRSSFERDALRNDLIAGGACAENPYTSIVREYFGVAPKPVPKPAELANAAMEACESRNKSLPLDANGAASPKAECSTVWLDVHKREQLAATIESKRKIEAEKRLSREAERRCEAEFIPERPKFQTTLFVLGIPTVGVAAAILMLMAVVRVFRWVSRGFMQS